MLGLSLTEFSIVPNKYLFEAQSLKTEFRGSSRCPQDPTKSGILYNSDVFYSEGS
jgi:hypothetical protein